MCCRQSLSGAVLSIHVASGITICSLSAMAMTLNPGKTGCFTAARCLLLVGSKKPLGGEHCSPMPGKAPLSFRSLLKGVDANGVSKYGVHGGAVIS